MNKIDWVRKLTSRKLWVAVTGMVAGFVLAFGGKAELAETISGCIMSVASVVAYIIGEGLVDAGYAAGEAKLEESLAIDEDQTHVDDHDDMGVA